MMVTLQVRDREWSQRNSEWSEWRDVERGSDNDGVDGYSVTIEGDDEVVTQVRVVVTYA
jgi:hypothetical protein